MQHQQPDLFVQIKNRDGEPVSRDFSFVRASNYPLTPGHRGVETSKEAAEAVKPKANKWEREILDALADHGPMTFWEIAKITNIPFDNAQPCVSRMRAAGKVTASGERRKNPNGRNSIVWRLA